MPNSDTIAALNRLIEIHNRSLPVYLASARPWSRPSDQAARQVLRLIADDHLRTVDRLAQLVLDYGGRVQLGEFPMDYTGLHDLSMAYVLSEVIREQRRDIRDIERCIDQLRLAPLARAAAEETLGAAKGHLDNLLEVQAGRAPAGNGAAAHAEPVTSGH